MSGVTPVRLTLSRSKGFSLRALSQATNGLRAINVARPGPWGNPYVVGRHGGAQYCVDLFEALIHGYIAVTVDDETYKAPNVYLHRLRAHGAILGGVNLACWCRADRPCHCTPLLHHANPIIFAAERDATAARLAARLSVGYRAEALQSWVDQAGSKAP